MVAFVAYRLVRRIMDFWFSFISRLLFVLVLGTTICICIWSVGESVFKDYISSGCGRLSDPDTLRHPRR